MDSNSTINSDNYEYADFLRDYLHCDEQELLRAWQQGFPPNRNLRMGDKEELMQRIDQLHNRAKQQAHRRRLANQRKHGVEQHDAGQPYKRQRSEKKRPLHNAYLNFLRDYRRTHTSLRPDEVMKRSARAWVRMSDEEKAKYRRHASAVSKYISLYLYLHITSKHFNKGSQGSTS